MKLILKCAVLLALFVSIQCTPPSTSKSFKVQFDSHLELSGKKFAIKDISPGLPTNWDTYNYVIIEFKSSTSQRFQLGFTTTWGYNDLRIMSYVPNGWNKLCIPLKYYKELPRAEADLAATFNQPRFTGWINLGGERGPLDGVDSIGIRMRMAIGNPTIEIRSIALAVEDPGDQYLEDTPAVDEYGQWNLGDYDGKVHALDQLKKDWDQEDQSMMASNDTLYSKYGGYLSAKTKGLGFFRTALINGRWWFIDPEGYEFLSVGVDCVGAGGGGNIKQADKRRNMFKELPPKEIGASFGAWNLYRRYGADYQSKANEMIIRRMKKWGVNTIANWSSAEVYNMNKKAFVLELDEVGIDRSLMGLADVYLPGFASTVNESIKKNVEPYVNNSWLIGYFIGNEPAWIGHEERLCDLIIQGVDRPIKTKLNTYLALGDTPQRRKDFIHNTFKIFLQTVDRSMKKNDPNHLDLGIRFGNVSDVDSSILAITKPIFDVLSFNCYDLSPSQEMMDRAFRITGLPMMIGEYHFGTSDRGNAQSLWQVNSQQERGMAYEYYTEKAYSHPGMIGTAYFQWCDQDLSGRFDGENYNCGLVDVTDRPYKYQVEAMMKTAERLQRIHAGVLEAVKEVPPHARGYEVIPSSWNDSILPTTLIH